MSTFAIRFEPEGRTFTARGPVELACAAAACDLWLEQPCAARQSCGKCRVRVRVGRAEITHADRRVLSPAELDAGWRLGCCLVLDGEAVIEIPPASRFAPAKWFGDDALLPDDFEPDAEALLLAPRSGPTVGLAFDLGSTTLAAALVDLRSGRVLASNTRLNPQVQHGADIITRIQFAQENPTGLVRLHELLRIALGEMIEELAEAAGVTPGAICIAALAGNAAMTHLALGADVTPLGHAPFLGQWTGERTRPAAYLGLPLHPRAQLHFLPLVRSHIGGDTVAAILATGLDQGDGWRLQLDLGTNSEVALARQGRIVVASTAAGPAFEGSKIAHGMRAAPGAIEAVFIDAQGDVRVKTIADEKPRGLCGSGLVDAVAELLRHRVIAPSGRMRLPAELAGLPAALVARAMDLPDGSCAFSLAPGVSLSAADVRQVQLAKAAIRAAAELLLRRCGVAPASLERVEIAGAFGNVLRKRSLLALGLVPAVEPERVRFAGNAAGAGVRLALADLRARRRAREIAAQCEYVELAGSAEYEEQFVAAIPFPPPEPNHVRA